ncbi:MAG TPA: hypothetical protein PKK60_00335 [archaeon]|nr:hypothetical protein [archaeon]
MRMNYEQAKARERYKIKRKIASSLGSGSESEVYRSDLVFKNGTKRRNVAVKEMIRRREVKYNSDIISQLSLKDRIVNAKKAYTSIKSAGLPVPSFFVPRIRTYSGRESIIMENLRTKYGKLYSINPGHNNPRPVFLKKLKIEKDSVLIRNLGSDLATILNLGFLPHAMDFWSFYKTNGSYERIISDLTLFTHKRDSYYSNYSKDYFSKKVKNMLVTISAELGSKEYDAFMDEFLHKVNKNTVSWNVNPTYAGHAYY